MDLFSDPASVLILEHGEDAGLEVAMWAEVILDHTTNGSLIRQPSAGGSGTVQMSPRAGAVT